MACRATSTATPGGIAAEQAPLSARAANSPNFFTGNAFPVEDETAHCLRNLPVWLEKVIREKQDALVIVTEWRGSAVHDDQWAGCRHGLEVDMRVVKVRAGILGEDVDLIVEEMPRRYRPLRSLRGPI